jgi:hypothetical protein
MTPTDRFETIMDALNQTIMDAHLAIDALCARHGFTVGPDTLAEKIREIDTRIGTLPESKNP